MSPQELLGYFLRFHHVAGLDLACDGAADATTTQQ
jgi:hypothetical protein